MPEGGRVGGTGSDGWVFWPCALLAMILHGWLVLGAHGLWGGADLLPHLRLIERMVEDPGLHNVYAPAYHVAGALLAPWIGLASVPKVVALLSAAAYIAGFRFFQRSAGLPEASAALFALSPYSFSLSWCIPKTELAGFGLAFVGLGMLGGRRYALLALVLAATFYVHTAAAIFLGLAGGVWALASRDGRALAALAAGTLGFAPLFAAHLAAGCTPAQSLMLTENDYLRATAKWSSAAVWDVIVALASPIAVALALVGARDLARRSAPLAAVCGVLFVLYLNELWLAPLTMRTALDLLRGLSVLAFVVAVVGGVALAERRRALPWLLGACALWAVVSVVFFVPRSCHVRAVGVDELRDLEVARCSFSWRGPAIHRAPRPEAAPPDRPGG